MSEEYNKYVSNMKSVYQSVENKIKSDFDNNNFNNELELLTKNNDKIKDYIVHLRIGTGLKDEKENLKALKELNETHINFMTSFYKLIGWNIFT